MVKIYTYDQNDSNIPFGAKHTYTYIAYIGEYPLGGGGSRWGGLVHFAPEPPTYSLTRHCDSVM